MQFGIENHPSTYRGAVWLIAGVVALFNYRDPAAVATILGIASSTVGGISIAFKDSAALAENVPPLATTIPSLEPPSPEDSTPPSKDSRDQNSIHDQALLEFFEAWDCALDHNPFLILEIGYTRPTDYVVHVWNAQGVGIGNAPKIIGVQNPSRMDALQEATMELRKLFGGAS